MKKIIKIIKIIIPEKLSNFIEYKLIPPQLYLKYKFEKKFGKKLNFKNPQTFNEKLQWKKLYDKNPLYTKCSDKYTVRDYVKNKIGEKYLIPLQLVTSKPNKINFDELKIPYIIKSNHGTSQLIIIKEKKEINKKMIFTTCKKWLNTNLYHTTKETQYLNIPPKIIIENLLLDENNNIPEDYKFHCFGGKVEFIQVDIDRFSNHKRMIVDKNWKIKPFMHAPKKNSKSIYETGTIKKPLNLNKMIKIAENLSSEFNYVRVDLYNINGKIYFGELTFTHGSGFESFFPEKYDLIYGKKIKIKN